MDQKKRVDIQKAVLQTVAAAGLIGIALLAPNVVVALDKLGVISNKRHLDSIRRARTVLVRNGFLAWEGNNLRVTQKGKKHLKSLEAHGYALPKPRRWDGKWRMLMFDIPEKRKTLRDKVRRTLFGMGFVRLQDSVWIYPYDCVEVVTLLKADFKIGKDLLYMVVETLEHDLPIRKRFDLN